VFSSRFKTIYLAKDSTTRTMTKKCTHVIARHTVLSLIQTPGFYFFDHPGKGATIGNRDTNRDGAFIISITQMLDYQYCSRCASDK
jgi:hypothetical protein